MKAKNVALILFLVFLLPIRVQAVTSVSQHMRHFASREAMLRQRIEQSKEFFEQERAAFKEKLQIIRDERKKAIVENLDIKLQNANSARTTQMTNTLGRLTTVLANLQSKLDAAETDQDKTAAQAAINAATTAIQEAQSAVATQAAKSYTADVTSEATVGTSMSTIMTTLRKDLQATLESVMRARKAVADAARAIYKLKLNADGASAATF